MLLRSAPASRRAAALVIRAKLRCKSRDIDLPMKVSLPADRYPPARGSLFLPETLQIAASGAEVAGRSAHAPDQLCLLCHVISRTLGGTRPQVLLQCLADYL